MLISQMLLAELTQEAANTKKILERVPTEHFNWKPHGKSFSLGTLAGHIAEIPRWVELNVNHDELDFGAQTYTPPKVTNTTELMQSFQDHLANAKAVLQNNVSDEALMKTWTLKRGDTIFFTIPKVAVVRSMVLNHIIHHRAQLGVYLRLLDIPVPGIYGPSADEPF